MNKQVRRIKKFLENSPELKISNLEDLSEVPRSYLWRIRAGQKQTLNPIQLERVAKVLSKYGFKPDFAEISNNT